MKIQGSPLILEGDEEKEGEKEMLGRGQHIELNILDMPSFLWKQIFYSRIVRLVKGDNSLLSILFC